MHDNQVSSVLILIVTFSKNTTTSLRHGERAKIHMCMVNFTNNTTHPHHADRSSYVKITIGSGVSQPADGQEHGRTPTRFNILDKSVEENRSD